MKLEDIYEVHENEILDLDFSPYYEAHDERSLLIATASKDHSVKIFDPKDQFKELRHIEDHKSAVVGVRFIQDTYDSDIKIVSAEAKGTISVRSLDDDLNLTLPTQRELKDNKIYCLGNNDTNIILGLDKKVQIGQLRTNNSVVLKKSALPSSKDKEFIKIEADDVGLY